MNSGETEDEWKRSAKSVRVRFIVSLAARRRATLITGNPKMLE